MQEPKRLQKSAIDVRVLGLALASLVLPLLASPQSAVDAGSYTVFQLGALPGGSSTPRSINLDGQIAGSSGSPHDVDTRACFWTSDGKVRSLGTLPGGDHSEGFGVNRRGEVVGSSNLPTVVHAFLWTLDGGMRDLGTLPGDRGSIAFGINGSGQIVGSSSGPRGIHAVLWSESGEIRDLGTLPGDDRCEAIAINSSGEVAGYSGNARATRAFLWTRKGGLRALGTLPGDTTSKPAAINDAGQVVGSSTGPQGTRAFLWTRKECGTLAPCRETITAPLPPSTNPAKSLAVPVPNLAPMRSCGPERRGCGTSTI